MTSAVLLNGLWQGALIVAVAGLITLVLPQRHASTRYAVWFASLIALTVVPFASQWHPAAAMEAIPWPMEHTAGVPTLVAAKAASASGMWPLLVWLAGTLFFFLRLALSYVRIDRIVRRATPAPELGADVMTSDDVAGPIAAGLFSPIVIIPTGLVESLDRRDLASIVQHERAHIRRGDVAGNFLQRVIEACLFFNPWVHVIGRQMIKEREASCDDWAVHASGEPHRYASCLARLAETATRSTSTLLTPSAIGSKSMIVGRVARLLDGKATQLKANYFVLGASVVSFGVLAVLLQTANGLASGGAPSLGNAVAGTGVSTNCNRDATVTDPAMPQIAKSDFHAGVAANVLVSISAEGQPVSAKVTTSSGYPAIDRAAVKAAMSSTYKPEISNCKPAAGSYLFHISTAP